MIHAIDGETASIGHVMPGRRRQGICNALQIAGKTTPGAGGHPYAAPTAAAKPGGKRPPGACGASAQNGQACLCASSGVDFASGWHAVPPVPGSLRKAARRCLSTSSDKHTDGSAPGCVVFCVAHMYVHARTPCRPTPTSKQPALWLFAWPMHPGPTATYDLSRRTPRPAQASP